MRSFVSLVGQFREDYNCRSACRVGRFRFAPNVAFVLR